MKNEDRFLEGLMVGILVGYLFFAFTFIVVILS